MMGVGRRVSSYSLLICLAAGAGSAGFAHALNPNGVLVLYNNASAEGREIAEYYAQVHPGVRLLGLSNVPLSEEITVATYLQTIRPQVRAALDQSVDVIVTTKGLPLRLYNEATPSTFPYQYTDSSGEQHTIFSDTYKRYSSLESELTRIDKFGTWKQLGDQTWWHPPEGSNPALNPYFGKEFSFRHIDPQNESMRLSARLDGYSSTDVINSIKRAQRAYVVPRYQQIVVDNAPAASAYSTTGMRALAELLAARGQNHVYDDTNTPVLSATTPVIGYDSHGVNDGPGGLEAGYISRQLQFQLNNGAIYQTWESYNAFSFRAGEVSGQGLVADWIRAGGTAAVGQVHEPGGSIYNVTNEDQLFDMMLKGFTFAEAAWSATPQLSYVNTMVGDPLMVWKRAMVGDANLDGMVSISDIIDISNNYGATNGTWRQGDFNGDGIVTIGDMIDAISNYGYVDPTMTVLPVSAAGAAASGGFAAVPEPGIMFFGGLAGIVLGMRRRRAR